MSVPKSERKEGTLIALTKAYDFASYTDRICSNEKVFLKRNRWCVNAQLVDVVHELAMSVALANEARLGNPKRFEYQTKAMEYTIRAETLMEIAYRDNVKDGFHTIPTDKIEYWTFLLLELRSAIRKWVSSDKKRLKESEKSPS